MSRRLRKHLIVWLWGGIFVYAGATKIIDPTSFARSIERYDALPYWAVSPLAIYLPWLEVVLGLALLLCKRLREAAAYLSLSLMFVFTAAFVIAWSRGISIDCGCFGGDSLQGSSPWLYLARNTAFIALGLWVAIQSSSLVTPFSHEEVGSSS